MMVLVFIREGLTWRSYWSLPVIVVLFIIRRYVRIGRSSPSLCTTQFLFQVIYLLLHGLIVVLSLGYMIAHLGVTFTRLDGIHTPLSIPFILLILFIFSARKITLLLGSYRFYLLGIPLTWVFLVWTWSYHVYLLHSLMHKFSPTDGTNCRDCVLTLVLWDKWIQIQQARYNKFVKSV